MLEHHQNQASSLHQGVHVSMFNFVFCTRDKCFISKGYDATTHFETTVEDVLEMYKRITGVAMFLPLLVVVVCCV